MTNLMDAKAKVVAWNWDDVIVPAHASGDELYRWNAEAVSKDEAEQKLTAQLTDHEAALAELEVKLVVLDRKHDEALTQRDLLISGLEALADRLYDGFLPYPNHAELREISNELRTLASEAKK